MTGEIKRSLRIFLCHTSVDISLVKGLLKRLSEDGIDAWLNEENILPGQSRSLEIPQAIERSDIVLVCLSSASVSQDGHIHKEIKYALDLADEKPEGTIFVIPARLDECEIPYRLRQYQCVDLFTEDGYRKLIRALTSQAERLQLEFPSGQSKRKTNLKESSATAQTVKNIDEPFHERSRWVGQDSRGHEEKVQKRNSSLSLNQKLTLLIGFLAVIGGITAALLSGHDWFASSPSTPETNYTGRVLDLVSQQPVQGAQVTLDLRSIPSIAYTDNEGIYLFEIDIQTQTSARLRVDAKGYEVYTRTIIISPTSKTIEDIRLTPLPIPVSTQTIAPPAIPTPTPAGITYSLRFVGNCPADSNGQNHNLYYVADDGNPQHLASIGGQIDKSFQARFSRSIRVYIELNSGITCSEILYVNKNGHYELVASGDVGNNGLVYQP